ncbi:hypothetical protein K0A97_02420 [Patescibacteria group bacterium]|nr:hypothetical protein [Patescibacteria group bacterium]
MENKRGQGLSTDAIILIIMGLVILVILILGFSLGWERINPFIKKNNVDQIVSNCQLACSMGNQYDYCGLNRILRAEGLLDENRDEVKFVEKTCYELSQGDYTHYGIASCPGITCP